MKDARLPFPSPVMALEESSDDDHYGPKAAAATSSRPEARVLLTIVMTL